MSKLLKIHSPSGLKYTGIQKELTIVHFLTFLFHTSITLFNPLKVCWTMMKIFEDEKSKSKSKYLFVANIRELARSLSDYGLCRYMRSGNHEALCRLLLRIYEQRHKLKVPVRPDRHNQRWGRAVNYSAPFRFRLDGRNWPNVSTVKSILRTVRP